ncbi:MAG TPA: hypothetical protein VK879_20680 [Candidatus Sulfomarinibacteraceae bacterium]|nr:hypothetical protein [Candidatus Sulfomarinibacteraceae bacterium]
MRRQPERRAGCQGGCRRVLLGLFLVTGAAGLFLLRWLWRLGRSGRTARGEPAEAVAVEEVQEARGRRAPRLRRIDLFVGAVVLLGMALIPLAVWGAPDWLTEPAFLSARRDEPQAPWLRTGRAWATDEAAQAALRATESARLDSYGWQDEEAGVAHIPLERAMDLLLERGESLLLTPLPPGAGAEPAVTATPEAP